MPTGRSLRCPNCGGTTSEGSRLCDYCRAPIATVRCAYCYQMNVPDAVHCSGCGAVLGLEPIGAPGDLTCPRCKTVLEVFEGQSGKLWDCKVCGGQFVENALLRELIERREAYGSALPRRARKWNPLLDPIRYLPCPACQTLMARKNFGGSSGVVVDACPGHGLWFDIGELPRILEFVESGGLASARKRELQELARARSSPDVVASLPPELVTQEPDLGVSLGDHVLRLLEKIADVIEKKLE